MLEPDLASDGSVDGITSSPRCSRRRATYRAQGRVYEKIKFRLAARQQSLRESPDATAAPIA